MSKLRSSKLDSLLSIITIICVGYLGFIQEAHIFLLRTFKRAFFFNFFLFFSEKTSRNPFFSILFI